MTNALFGALGAMSPAQGTMNNLTFGNDQYQYYETICSGSPAGAGGLRRHVGRAHPHDQFAPDRSRKSWNCASPWCWRISTSGRARAAGADWNAGDGTSRTIRFLERMECAILSSHRSRRPRGLDGGGNGETGSTDIRAVDGKLRRLKASDQTVVEAGETVIVTTPTPGGYGRE